jgi:hypothetical protein
MKEGTYTSEIRMGTGVKDDQQERIYSEEEDNVAN